MAEQAGRFQIVMTTAGSDEQATQIARGLVERRLAACVNIIDGVCSIYRWEGEIQREGERLLLIKSERRLFEPLRAAIRELHSYEVPEIVAVPIEGGDPNYLDWLSGCLESD